MYFLLGYFIASKLGFSENQSIASSFIALGVSFVCLFLYDKFVVKKQKNSEIDIISIEKEDTSEMIDNCKNKDIF